MKSLVRCTFLRLLINSARIASLIALNSRIVEKVQEKANNIAPFQKVEQKVWRCLCAFRGRICRIWKNIRGMKQNRVRNLIISNFVRGKGVLRDIFK